MGGWEDGKGVPFRERRREEGREGGQRGRRGKNAGERERRARRPADRRAARPPEALRLAADPTAARKSIPASQQHPSFLRQIKATKCFT